MKATKKLVLVTAAVLPVLFASGAYAFGGKSGGKGFDNFGGKCGGFDRGIIRQLDLTDEQEDQLDAMRQAKREQKRSDRDATRVARQAEMQSYQTKINNLVLADDFSEEDAKLLATEMVNSQIELRTQMLKERYDMLNILTDEQKEQYKELQAERMQDCADRLSRRMEKASN